MKETKRYSITGTLHGNQYYTQSEGEARKQFHKEYNGESIIHVRVRDSKGVKILQDYKNNTTDLF